MRPCGRHKGVESWADCSVVYRLGFITCAGWRTMGALGPLGGVSHGVLICSCVGLVWPLAPVVALGALGLSSEEAPASRDSLWGQPRIYVCSEKVYLLLGKWKRHINLL